MVEKIVPFKARAAQNRNKATTLMYDKILETIKVEVLKGNPWVTVNLNKFTISMDSIGDLIPLTFSLEELLEEVIEMLSKDGFELALENDDWLKISW